MNLVRIPKWYLPFAAMLALESIRPAEDPLAGIDIEREYELIRQKRSTLSRAKRDAVMARWERMRRGGGKNDMKSLLDELDAAEQKAWDALTRYKFQMFGYWAAIWVHLNRISQAQRPNPWRELVHNARHIQKTRRKVA